MRMYAQEIQKADPGLAKDLRKWADQEEFLDVFGSEVMNAFKEEAEKKENG